MLQAYLEKEKVSTLLYSHIESLKHPNLDHIESEMDFQFPEHHRAPGNLNFQFGYVVIP